MENLEHQYFPFGFPVSGKAVDEYRLLDLVRDLEEDRRPEAVVMRELASRMEIRRKREAPEARPVRSGHLLGMSFLLDIFRYVAHRYCFEEQRGVMRRAGEYLRQRCPAVPVDRLLGSFVDRYPPAPLLRGEESKEEFLQRGREEKPNRESAVVEVVLLFFSMANRALIPCRGLFDDSDLESEVKYKAAVEALNSFFNKEPPVDRVGKTLFELLYAPLAACPDSLEGQLEWILENWRDILPEHFLRRLLVVRGILREENRGRGAVEGSLEVLRFGAGGYEEYEAYTKDRDWMPNVVLLAKSTHVWLDQLSRRYGRHIRTLDAVPDEELDRIARWGFTSLWLIGLWERSPASQRIKQIMGNPEALSSAYSVYDYVIAGDLGGEEAYENVRRRAWERGIRVASDMVPNHVGVYSKWVIEHPDWFIQLDHPPYPDYQFTGEDLSRDSRVTVQIEDGYWSHTNAAVVFKRIDQWTGAVKYIYHGNDGTHMPWNDTAQLNYLNPEVREAVIQTILHVARKFSVIRFDAAMTLAKKHYQRLWFPAPGEGGAIPSRSEHGLTRDEFDRVFPKEFWREVVDRIASEMPDTLLVAEAFWLMEGYFVRTLGMHRVYNSAFMNMLKMEENANYRQTVKNVLEYSPGILQRFVNFMNNPDERTAIEQFGDGDKYYGVAVMMVTMPGLPMFGHGQIEGFHERYGMEYGRAYWDEASDEGMVARHEREIFPLMRKRYLFSGVESFAFYDFWASGGGVDEDVFAYSNRCEGERALVVYNNKFKQTSGWVKTSTAINQGTTQEPRFMHRTLGEALGINGGEGRYYVFRDHRTGLEYLRTGRSLVDEGLFVSLEAYQYQVFLDFREVYDEDGSWGCLVGRLGGAGVPDMFRAHRELVLEPVLVPFRRIVDQGTLQSLAALPAEEWEPAEVWQRFQEDLESLGKAATERGRPPVDMHTIAGGIERDLKRLAELRERCILDERAMSLDGRNASDETSSDTDTPGGEDGSGKKGETAAEGTAGPEADGEQETRRLQPDPAAAWAVLRRLEKVFARSDDEAASGAWLDEWLLSPRIQESFAAADGDGHEAYLSAQRVRIALMFPGVLEKAEVTGFQDTLGKLFQNPVVQEYLQLNKYDNVIWFAKERFDSLVDSLGFSAAMRIPIDPRGREDDFKQEVLELRDRCAMLKDAAERSGYRAETFLEMLD